MISKINKMYICWGEIYFNSFGFWCRNKVIVELY